MKSAFSFIKQIFRKFRVSSGFLLAGHKEEVLTIALSHFSIQKERLL